MTISLDKSISACLFYGKENSMKKDDNRTPRCGSVTICGHWFHNMELIASGGNALVYAALSDSSEPVCVREYVPRSCYLGRREDGPPLFSVPRETILERFTAELNNAKEAASQLSNADAPFLSDPDVLCSVSRLFAADSVLLSEFRPENGQVEESGSPFPDVERLQQSVSIMKSLLTSIGTLHRGGWLHCDLSEKNLRLSGTAEVPTVHIFDFGSARKLDENGVCWIHSKDSIPASTIVYRPPELKQCGYLSKATDLYQCCMVFYSLIIAEKPVLFLNPELFDECFVAEEDRELLLEEIEALAVPDQIRERVLSIVMEGLAYHQENRYQSADEFLTELCELEERLRLYADNKLFAAVSRLNNTKLENYSGLDTSFLPALCPPVQIENKETSEETPEALVQLLRSGESIYLHGVGGAGKSTALREVLRLLEEDQKLVLYVPLKHVDRPLWDWLSNALGQAQAETFQAIAGSEGEEPVYLLLDGLNELADKRHVPQELGFLMGCQNLCLLLSGRDADPPLPGFREAELLSLTSEQVYNLFPFAPEVIKGIKNPLICRLYMLESNSGGPVKDETLGGLLSRYVERIMDWERYTVDPKIVANVPIFVGHIAASMAAAGKLSITEYELENSIEEWIVSGEYRRQVLQALGSRMYYPSLLEDGGWSAVLEELIRRLCRDYLTSFSYDGKERHLSFPHETFRDFWCAKNYCFDVAHSSAPADSPLWCGEIEGNWSDVRDMLSDLLSEKELLRLLDAHRGRVFEAGNVNAQWRLFEALKKNRRFDLTGVDFSGLDLRMVSLRDVVIRHGGSDFTGAMIGGSTLVYSESPILCYHMAKIDPTGRKLAILGEELKPGEGLKPLVEIRDLRTGLLLSSTELDPERFCVLKEEAMNMLWSEDSSELLIQSEGCLVRICGGGSASYVQLEHIIPHVVFFYNGRLLAVGETTSEYKNNWWHTVVDYWVSADITSQVYGRSAEERLLLPPLGLLALMDGEAALTAVTEDGRYLFFAWHYEKLSMLLRYDLLTGTHQFLASACEDCQHAGMIVAPHGSSCLIYQNGASPKVFVYDWMSLCEDRYGVAAKTELLTGLVDDVQNGEIDFSLVMQQEGSLHLACVSGGAAAFSDLTWDGGEIQKVYGYRTCGGAGFSARSETLIAPLLGSTASFRSWIGFPEFDTISAFQFLKWGIDGTLALRFGVLTRLVHTSAQAVTLGPMLQIPAHLDKSTLIQWSYSPDERYFAYRAKNGTEVYDFVFDTKNGTTVQLGSMDACPQAGEMPLFIWSNDSRILVTMDGGYDPPCVQNWYEFSTNSWTALPEERVWFFSSGLNYAVTFFQSDEQKLGIELLNLRSGERRPVSDQCQSLDIMAWTADEKWLALIGENAHDCKPTSWFFNIEDGQVVQGPTLTDVRRSPSLFLVTRDRTLLQLWHETKELRITRLDGTSIELSFSEHRHELLYMSISPDDQVLLLLFTDGELMFYNLPSILRCENPPPFRRLHLIPNLNLDGANFDGAVFDSEQTLRIATENGGKTDKASLKVQK